MTPGELDLVRPLLDLGGTAFIAGVIVFSAYKLLTRFGVPFISSQHEIAKAMGQQAQSMSSMTDSVHDFIGRDHSEHKEILLGLQVVGKELKTLVDEVSRLKNYGYEINKTQQNKKTNLRNVST